MGLFIKKTTKKLARDIVDNYKDWQQTNYTFNKTTNNTQIWTKNGLAYLDYYPGSLGSFNIFEKILIKRAIITSTTLRALN